MRRERTIPDALTTFLHGLIFFIFVFSHTAAAQSNTAGNQSPKSKNAEVDWIQKVVDNWSYVCQNELKIEAKTLPWSIFYDTTSAWHLNPDLNILPAHEKTQRTVVFGGRTYPLFKTSHAQNVWIPEREPIPVSSYLNSTMPYAQNKKAYFVAPLPSLFRKLATPDQAGVLELLFLGNAIHELTHTRQLPMVIPQLLEIHKTDSRKSLDDNTVEQEYSNNPRYKQLYADESKHYWNAVFTSDNDSCITKCKQALQLTEIRKSEFFSATNQSLGRADEIFLSLEGSAMWAQYRVMLKNVPNPNERDLISWLVQQSPAWSQERGLALFLLIDRFDPSWKNQFFEKQLPLAYGHLAGVLAKRTK